MKQLLIAEGTGSLTLPMAEARGFTPCFDKLAGKLTKEYAVISIEDLNVKTMLKLWGRKISDYAFAEFVSILEWEALINGCTVIKVDRWLPSSKACHVCGAIYADLSIKDRS